VFGAVAIAAALFASAACSQVPFVPDQWQYGRPEEASTLRYCLDKRDPDWPVAADIGEALAAALLLKPSVHVVDNTLVTNDLDDLYPTLLQFCDLYLGFKLLPGAYPPWMVLTRPYYEVSYVYLSAKPGLSALADIPASAKIGAAIGTAADFRLVQYLESIPTTQRWNRVPLTTSEAAIDAVKNGSVDVALVWGPSFWAMQQQDPTLASLHVLAPRPLPATTVGVGAAMLGNQPFLRSNVDQAIQALAADGTIQAILDKRHFPATVPR